MYFLIQLKTRKLCVDRLQMLRAVPQKVSILGALNQQFSLQFKMLMDKRHTTGNIFNDLESSPNLNNI